MPLTANALPDVQKSFVEGAVAVFDEFETIPRVVTTRTLGEVAEWPIAPVLKTGVPQGTESSNLSLSA